MSEAVDIFVNNGTLLTGVLVACVVVGTALPEPGARRTERIALRLAVAVFDLVLLLVATFHVVYVGAAVGAYGGRTVEAMLPQGRSSSAPSPWRLPSTSRHAGSGCRANASP